MKNNLTQILLVVFMTLAIVHGWTTERQPCVAEDDDSCIVAAFTRPTDKCPYGNAQEICFALDKSAVKQATYCYDACAQCLMCVRYSGCCASGDAQYQDECTSSCLSLFQ
jgi:hypothetical protein